MQGDVISLVLYMKTLVGKILQFFTHSNAR